MLLESVLHVVAEVLPRQRIPGTHLMLPLAGLCWPVSSLRPTHMAHWPGFSVSGPTSGFQHGGWSGTHNQLSMADIVKMGLTRGKASSKPVVTAGRGYAGQYPSLPTNQNLKQSGSMVPPTELDKGSQPAQDSVRVKNDCHSAADSKLPYGTDWSPQDDTTSSNQSSLPQTECNERILNNSSSYHPHYMEQEAEDDATTDVSNFQSLSLHNDELAAKRTFEDHPAVIIPDHLHVTNTVCASFSFGSYVYGAFSELLPQKISDSNVEFPAIEESELVDQIDARNQVHNVSQANELSTDLLDPSGEYGMPSVSCHAYSNSSQKSTIEDDTISHLSNLDMLETDCIMEIVSRTNVETVVCIASLCKIIRRFITHHSFISSLRLGSRFGCSLYLGYFLSFRHNVHLRPKFVRTPFAQKLLARLESSLDSDQFCQDLFDCAPIGSDKDYLVLREHIDPLFCVWNPITKVLLFLPIRRHGITHSSSCILRVDGESFKVNLIKLRLNRRRLITQSFTSQHNVFSLESNRGKPVPGIWTDVSVMAVPGPIAKISKCSAFPVVLYGVCYWLCKRSGKYVVLKVKLDTHEAPEFIDVPVECSLTAQFQRNNMLLVPTTGSSIGHIDRGELDGRLGLVAIDTHNVTTWMRSDTGYWARGVVTSRDRVMRSLNVLPRRKPVQLELVWCAKASGILLINVAGCGFAMLNLNTLDTGFVEKTSVERHVPGIRIRSSCPFEFDFVSCLCGMKKF